MNALLHWWGRQIRVAGSKHELESRTPQQGCVERFAALVGMANHDVSCITTH